MLVDKLTCAFWFTFSAFFAFSTSCGSGLLTLKTFSTYMSRYSKRKVKWSAQDLQFIVIINILSSLKPTSFIRLSVWRISMSSELLLPTPFCGGGKSFLDMFFCNPLPLPEPGMGPPRPVGFLTPLVGAPRLRRYVTGSIPESSSCHLMSSGPICTQAIFPTVTSN